MKDTGGGRGNPAATALTREEVLGGLVGRRASTALYAIENRSASLALQDRHAAVPAICEDMVATRERAYFVAVAAGRHGHDPPSMQVLERTAPAWAHLVPRDPTTRAEMVHRLSRAHLFRARDVPRTRLALGFDDAPVQAAYQQRFGTPLDAAYAAEVPAAERRRWLRSRLAGRLEDLPPFWSAFSLTLTQTVGAGILALPIALAGLGPLPGLLLLVLLGAMNVLTAAAVAETFARTGSVRWAGAYFGRVVSQHLGRGAGRVLSLTLAALTVVALVAYYVGLSSTLELATGAPAAVWVAGLFGVTLAFVWRGRLGATVASALVVGAVNLALIGLLAVVAFTRLELGNLLHAEVPFIGGRQLDPAVVELVFGVVLLAFFGHTAVANGARVILRRDPSGRALIRGTTAAMGASIAVYGLWVVAVGGAVGAARLAAEPGTALAPLQEAAGPVVLVLGTIFAILAMGMAAIHFSIGLHHQTTELLAAAGPARARVAGIVPLVAVFAAVEALVLTGRESFTGALSFIGTLTAPLLAGIFPLLLLAAARRRGEYEPAGVLPGIGRAATAGLYLLFLAAVVLHGAVIWQGPLPRLAALVMALAVLAVTASAVRARAFRPQACLEIRRDGDSGIDRVRLVADGRRVPAALEVTSARGTKTASPFSGSQNLDEDAVAFSLVLGHIDVGSLRVWAHEVTLAGTTSPLEVGVTLADDDRGTRALRLTAGEGTVAVHPGAPLQVRVELLRARGGGP